ncbi:MAG: hypothetical protein PHT88_04505 [Candidatus Moranbacteria bacterium]|nr:hypothetical protein [Candidatus Moranbacteria bacterium]
MRGWMIKLAWIMATFFAGLAMIFVLLVLGVQHGDTYQGQAYPSFTAAAKYVVKKSLRTVKNGIYHEATIHNPEGDTIPDWVDDAIFGTIKKAF